VRSVAVGLLLLGACDGSSADQDVVDLVLVVPDSSIRAEGAECAGARPYQHVHRGAVFTVESEDGTVLFEGQLPAGRAENAAPDIDWGVERFPTVCVMELQVPELPAQPRYQLRLEQGRPLPFDADRLRDHEPVRLVVR
jgi:hypothetical protein